MASFFEKRSQVETADLDSAWRWENFRQRYFESYEMWEQAQEAEQRAQNYFQRIQAVEQQVA